MAEGQKRLILISVKGGGTPLAPPPIPPLRGGYGGSGPPCGGVTGGRRRPKEADFNQRERHRTLPLDPLAGGYGDSRPRLPKVCQSFGSHSWAGCKGELLTPYLNFSGGHPPLPPGRGRSPLHPHTPLAGGLRGVGAPLAGVTGGRRRPTHGRRPKEVDFNQRERRGDTPRSPSHTPLAGGLRGVGAPLRGLRGVGEGRPMAEGQRRLILISVKGDLAPGPPRRGLWGFPPPFAEGMPRFWVPLVGGLQRGAVDPLS